MIATLEYDWCLDTIRDQEKQRYNDRCGGEFKHSIAITEGELALVEGSSR